MLLEEIAGLATVTNVISGTNFKTYHGWQFLQNLPDGLRAPIYQHLIEKAQAHQKDFLLSTANLRRASDSQHHSYGKESGEGMDDAECTT